MQPKHTPSLRPLISLACAVAFLSLESRASGHPFFKTLKRELAAMPLPADLYTGVSRTGQHWKVQYAPEKAGLKIDPSEPFALLVTVTLAASEQSPDGAQNPASGLQSGTAPKSIHSLLLDFSATMPQHFHGLAYNPIVEEVVGKGVVPESKTFRVSNIEFHMPGWWRLAVKVTGTDLRGGTVHTETINFDVVI